MNPEDTPKPSNPTPPPNILPDTEQIRRAKVNEDAAARMRRRTPWSDSDIHRRVREFEDSQLPENWPPGFAEAVQRSGYALTTRETAIALEFYSAGTAALLDTIHKMSQSLDEQETL